MKQTTKDVQTFLIITHEISLSSLGYFHTLIKHKNANVMLRLCRNILCIQGFKYNNTSPNHIDSNLTILFIEFTYTNDKYLKNSVINKNKKDQSLIEDICSEGWNVAPLIVISTRIRGTTYNSSIKSNKDKYKLMKHKIIDILNKINTIAIHHLTSIILHKRKLENNQQLPNLHEPP